MQATGPDIPNGGPWHMPAAGAPWPVGDARVQAMPAFLPVQAANMGASGPLAVPSVPWLDADD